MAAPDPVSAASTSKAATTWTPPKPRPSAPKLAAPPMWPMPEELSGMPWFATMLAIAVIALYAYTISFFYAGAHGGVDQAGYLMTARLIAGDKNVYAPTAPAAFTQEPSFAEFPSTAPATSPATNTAAASYPTKPPYPLAAGEDPHPRPSPIQTSARFDFIRNRLSFIPESPFQFASLMCIMTEPYGPPDPSQPAQYRIYAKYPFGFPLLVAIARRIAGFDAMYWVNPICTVLAAYFAYFLFRQAMSPFISLLGVIWLAANPLVFFYANDANSHASTLLCVNLGFWALLSWLRTQQQWRAWIAGLALGYACTIRYSEFLLVLPVAFAALLNFRFSLKRAVASLSLLMAWAIPIAVLAGVCWVAFGAPWKTGYTYCRESTGFAWKYLTGDFGDGQMHQGNWETLITQLNHMGLFMLWPLAVAGIFAMLGSAWRLGGVIALWVLPSAILYMLYYWAPTGENTVGYLRFFISIMPGLIFAALWLLERALTRLMPETLPALVLSTLFGLFVLIAAALYLDDATVQGFPRIVPQIWAALVHLFSMGKIAVACGSLFLLLIAAMWFGDTDAGMSRASVALGAGILTALGCGFNLYNMLPQVETAHERWNGLRITLENMRDAVPKGSVVFSDDLLLNQLDAIGSWKLISANTFNSNTFTITKIRLDRADKDKDGQEDPDPRQLDRLRFIVELLGRPNRLGNWVAKPAPELLKMEYAVINENLDEGRRVTFLRLEKGDNDAQGPPPSRFDVPTPPGCKVKEIRSWKIPAVENPQILQGFGRANRVGNQRQSPAEQRPDSEYRLYEVVRKTPPTSSTSATTIPATSPAK